MSGISGIGSSGYNYQSTYASLSSGKKINSAADGAAQLAISEKMKAQESGYEAGNQNVSMAKDALNIADGAMSGITEYLQNIKELAVKASNTMTVTPSDREDIQNQIEQYKQGIQQIAQSTQYNTQPLLDGSNKSFELATNGSGSMYSISGANTTLEALGIADFDVTKDFDMKAIDDAMDKVSRQRSTMGAQTNGLEHVYQYNSITSLNTAASISKMTDTEYGKAITEMKKNQALQSYQIAMKKKEQEEKENKVMNLFT